jgi:LmbE family N-acetylglucosaminyl deacetylase
MAKLVVLGVGAHPDDMEFGAAGTFAKFAEDGADCYYLICTDGSKGSTDPKMTSERLADIRMKEQKASAKMLGIRNVFFLKNKDGELVADLKLKKEIVRHIRKLKPDIVITSDPTFLYNEGYVNHSDHRATGYATIDAVFPMSRNIMTFPELKKEGLEPHRVKQLYLVNLQNPNYGVDITKTIDLKVRAMSLHQSQGIGMGKRFGYKYAEPFFKIEFRI